MRIKSAAVLQDGTIHEGANHSDILERIIKAKVLMRSEPQFGFVTECGHWCNRYEARVIAERAGQLKEGAAKSLVLRAQDLKGVGE